MLKKFTVKPNLIVTIKIQAIRFTPSNYFTCILNTFWEQYFVLEF